MSTFHTFLPFILSFSLLPVQVPDPVQTTIAFTHVTVVDVSNGTLQPDMTVVITGDLIAEVRKSEKLVSATGRVVNASGKFLIPGLWDMHVHWYDQNYIPLFILNGVTGIRQMFGFPVHREWRKQMEQGSLLGPRMVVASPIVDGPNPIWPFSISVSNATQARNSVRKLKENGADFIKVYGLIPRDAFYAIADETRRLGITFAGHVPQSVSAFEASDAGQKSIEHMSGIIEACSTREDELRVMRQDVWKKRPSGQRVPTSGVTRPLTRMMLESYSAEKAAQLFERLKRNRTWQCPTLTVLRSTAFINDPGFRNDPRLNYLPAEFKTRWDPGSNPRFKERTAEDIQVARLLYKKQFEIVGMMRRAGVEFLAGTDVFNPFCFPGFSLHDELDLLVQAGLTPLEALQSATINPARFLGREAELGTVEQGKLADLVVLDANPLEDIHNTQKINAVVVNGKLLQKAALDSLLLHVQELTNAK